MNNKKVTAEVFRPFEFQAEKFKKGKKIPMTESCYIFAKQAGFVGEKIVEAKSKKKANRK